MNLHFIIIIIIITYDDRMRPTFQSIRLTHATAFMHLCMPTIVMLIFQALISYHLYMLSLIGRETLNMELYYYPMHLWLKQITLICCYWSSLDCYEIFFMRVSADCIVKVGMFVLV